jgi:tRNA pseudouridine-54 N-methylase
MKAVLVREFGEYILHKYADAEVVFAMSDHKKADEKDLHEQVEDTDAKKVDINDPLVAMVSQAISKTKI